MQSLRDPIRANASKRLYPICLPLGATMMYVAAFALAVFAITYKPRTNQSKTVRASRYPSHFVAPLQDFKDFNLRQCLFGLHLLRPETETVAIVESEKPANR